MILLRALTSALRTLLLATLAAALAGCKERKFSMSGSFSGPSSRREWRTNDRWTISKTRDGITRTLDTVSGVEIKDGRVTKLPAAAVVKVEESGGAAARQAELRESGGSSELWITENGSSRKPRPKTTPGPSSV